MTEHDPIAEPSADPARDARQDDRVSGEHSDGRWMSYREIAKARDINVEYAKKLSIKQGWRRVPGNDGANRVYVPVAWLKSRREPSREPPSAATRDNSHDVKSLETFAAALVAMRDAHAAEVVALRAQLDLTSGMLGDRTRALAAFELKLVEAERNQAAIMAQLDAALVAVQAADALRAADDARKAQSRWSRVRAAWRGQ